MDFECNCGRNFKTQRSINSHARFCSDYTGKRKSEYLTEGNKYLCECGRIFEKSQSLNAHFSHCIIHRKDKPAIDRFLNSRGWSKGKTKESDKFQDPRDVLKMTRFGETPGTRRYYEEKRLLENFSDFVNSYDKPILIAHNAPFDMKMVNTRMKLYGLKPLNVSVLDTNNILKLFFLPMLK
jgi:Icc-related predicted phosphoesterase